MKSGSLMMGLRVLAFVALVGLLGELVVRARPLWAWPRASTTHVSTSHADSGFFADYRVRRDAVRSQEMAALKGIIDDTGAAAAARAEASTRYLRLEQSQGREMQIESLVKAKGFPDAAAILTPNELVVVVREARLSRPQVAQIVNIGQEVTGLGPQSISIIPKG